MIADGLGGYAMGTADGIRTRRYHGLLLVASPQTERRFMLVNGVEAWIEGENGPVALSSQRYAGGVVHSDGVSRLHSFSADPLPTWTYSLSSGGEVVHDVTGVQGRAAVILRWRATGLPRVRLRARLLMSGRDWHALHHENASFSFGAQRLSDNRWRWTPYDGVPAVVVDTDAHYADNPIWYRQFLYTEDEARGLECREDLASPGIFTWDLESGESAELMLTTGQPWPTLPPKKGTILLRDDELSRLRGFTTPVERAAESYLVTRGSRTSIIAGYPWFTDWGRDTFISLNGLCLARARADIAESILLCWCDVLSEGMMPNLFPSESATPEYNSVDASLWFVIAVRELLAASPTVTEVKRRRLVDCCEAILDRYRRGARFDIRMDSDGLLAAGVPGVALTWMDAVIDGQPVTPRIGKPVEVQALWINALDFGASWDARWGTERDRARASFAERFWNPKRRCLYDVVDVDHVAGKVDDLLRPNQIFACGGLPVPVLTGERAEQVVSIVEKKLWTPMGPRSLGPDEPGYVGQVGGPMRQRDGGYHQGTVWPWLAFPFVDAWTRVHGGDALSWKAAHKKFLPGLLSHATDNFGHVAEIADGDAPHQARGCPCQAWSVAALIRARGQGG